MFTTLLSYSRDTIFMILSYSGHDLGILGPYSDHILDILTYMLNILYLYAVSTEAVLIHSACILAFMSLQLDSFEFRAIESILRIIYESSDCDKVIEAVAVTIYNITCRYSYHTNSILMSY